MMVRDASYFQPELRMGFYISERMKRVWAANVENLLVLDSVCHQLNIPYFLDYGTLLGAVRHRGFIPWDDDVDVTMLRADYMRFIEESYSLLPKGMYVTSYYTNEKHIVPQAALLNRNDVGENRDVTNRFHGCPFITGIDIMPLDFIPSSIESRKEMLIYYSIFYDGGNRFDELKENGELDGILEKIENLLGYRFDRNKDLRRQFYLEADRIAMGVAPEDANAIAWLPDIASKGWGWERPIDWHRESVRLTFEDVPLDAPIDYAAILSQYYGADYMSRFVRGGSEHVYPFYQEQLDFVKIHNPDLASRIFSYAEDGGWGKSTLSLAEKKNLITTINELLNVIDQLTYEELDINNLWFTLSNCQQAAIDIGNMVEDRMEKPGPIVSLLELLCESLYQCSKSECEIEEPWRILMDIKEAVDELPVIDCQ